MHDQVATLLRSPSGYDVRELAASMIAEVGRETADLERQIDRLQQDVRKVFQAVGRLSDYNARYRALCFQLLLQEHIVDLCVRGAYADAHPNDRAKHVRTALHAAVGTLRQLASAMTGQNFTPTGGLMMTGAGDLIARADRLAHAVIATSPRSLLAATASAQPAHLALMCGEKGLGPRLTAFELAATGYEDAALQFLIASGGDDVSFDVRAWSIERFELLWEERGLSNGAQLFHLNAFSPIASGLSRSYVESGRAEDARRAALLHRGAAERVGNDLGLVTAELQIAAADEHIDQVAAITRLESVLTGDRAMCLLSGSNQVARLRILDAMGRLALMLNAQGATAGRQQWVATAQASLAGSTNAHLKATMKRITDADIWQAPDTGTGWDATPVRLGTFTPRHRGGLADPAEDGAGRALFHVCRDINACVAAEHVPALVRALARLAAMMLDRGKQFTKKDRPDRAFEMGQVMRKVDAWRPDKRRQHLSAPLPERWLVDTNREAMHLAELCWEFADQYSPATGLVALKTAGRAARRVSDDIGSEPHLRYWRLLAKRAHRLGRWQEEVNAELKVAWICTAAGQRRQQDATLAARWAYRAMRAGFERLANLYEVTTLLSKEWAAYPARIARAFAYSNQQSWEAFSALDFGQGLALSAMRSAGSATLHDLIDLQHDEQRLHTKLVPGGKAEVEQLREVRTRILGLTRQGGSLLLTDSGPGEQNWLLWELGPDAAIVQLGKTNDDVVISAARLVDGQPAYHTMELGKFGAVKSLMRRMWAVIDIDPLASSDHRLASRSALDAAYDMLIAPLQDFLADTTSWYIVAHDELASLPFHAIRTPQGRFVVEDVAIGYAPSVKALADAVSSQPMDGPALVIGLADEPVAGNEVRDIARIIEGTGAEVVAADNGPDRMLDGDIRWRMIHIVAHGESLPFPRALESYLEFGPRKVTAREIIDHGVQAGLVFINACHLATSSPFGGDLYGFPFAFLASGTPVIAAAAPIYRPYAGWFAQSLHRSLLAGMTPLAAFTSTVRSFIADPWQRHPVFWAPYFYVGGSGPVDHGRSGDGNP